MNKKVLSILLATIFFSPFLASAQSSSFIFTPFNDGAQQSTAIVSVSMDTQVCSGNSGAWGFYSSDYPEIHSEIFSGETLTGSWEIPYLPYKDDEEGLGKTYLTSLILVCLVADDWGSLGAQYVFDDFINDHGLRPLFFYDLPTNTQIASVYIGAGNDLAVSVATNLIRWVFEILVVTFSIAIGIYFFYWAYRQAKNASQGKSVGHRTETESEKFRKTLKTHKKKMAKLRNNFKL